MLSKTMALLPQMLEGLTVTLCIWLIVMVLALSLGVPVALLRMSRIAAVSAATKLYIDIMRGTPLMLQICFIFFGLPEVGIVFPRFATAILAFTLNYTAYFAEIFRSGLQSISKGQWEAGQVLGIKKPILFFNVILPQTVKNILPSMTNEITTLLKDTALVQIIGISDLLRQGKVYANSMSSLMPFVFVGIIYFIAISIITKLCEKGEKSLAYYQ